MSTDTTQNRSYPLPDPENVAVEDAARLRAAIEQIDGDMAAVFATAAEAISKVPPAASEEAAGTIRLATAADMAAGTEAHAVPSVARTAAFVLQKVGDLVGSAPEALNTLFEIAAALKGNPAVIDVLQTAIDTKANAADVVNKAGGQTLLGGFVSTAYNAGSKSNGTFTPSPANGNLQRATNDGAHAVSPPAGDWSMVVRYTNGPNAGALTTAGFDVTTGTFVTTPNARHLLYMTQIDGDSHLHITRVA